MPSANVYNMDGEVVRAEELDGYVFGAPVNTAVLHQVVTAQLTNRRQGNASTKTRADVSGGGKKPYRQKGTGHARQGSTRAPQYRGGGVVFGPHPHAYERKIPRKMARLALRSALSDKAANGRILVMEGLTFEEPRTKDMEALLAKLPLERHVLLLMPERDENVILSSRNIHRIKLCHVSSINVVELLKYDHLMMPPATVERIVEMFGQEADDRIQLKRHPRVVWRRQQRRSGTAVAAASTTPEASATPATPEPPAEAEPAEPQAESGTKPSTTRRRSRSQEE
jgi:large subunit ribosomal protein L4